MNVGKAIKMARQASGVKQRDLAKKVGITPTALCQIENGIKQPRMLTMLEICHKLDVPITLLYMLGIEEVDILYEKQHIDRTVYPSIQDLIIKIFTNGKILPLKMQTHCHS